MAKLSWVGDRMDRDFVDSLNDYANAWSPRKMPHVTRGIETSFVLTDGIYEVLEQTKPLKCVRYFLHVTSGERRRITSGEARVIWRENQHEE